MDRAQVRGPDLHGIGVGIGPGSFTGLRLGIVAAKSLAYAWRVRLMGIETARLLAWQARSSVISAGRTPAVRMWTLQNAQRGEWFVGCFQVNAESPPDTVFPVQLMNRETWLGLLSAGDWVTGPVAAAQSELIAELGAMLTPVACHAPHAERWIDLFELMLDLAPATPGEGIDRAVWTMRPLYVRPSAAEENK